MRDIFHGIPQSIHQMVKTIARTVDNAGGVFVPRIGGKFRHGVSAVGMHHHFVFLQPRNPMKQRPRPFVGRGDTVNPFAAQFFVGFGFGTVGPDALARLAVFTDVLCYIAVEQPCLF